MIFISLTEQAARAGFDPMKKGFTLIELLIAIVLISTGSIVLMHLMGVAILADSNLEFAVVSLNLANEKLEQLKGTDYSLIASATENSISGFPWLKDRVVTVSEVEAGLKDVQVQLRWLEGAREGSVNVRTYIADY